VKSSPRRATSCRSASRPAACCAAPSGSTRRSRSRAGPAIRAARRFARSSTAGGSSGGEATRGYAREHSLPLVSTIEVLDAHLSERELVRPDGAESLETAVGCVPARAYVDLLDRRHFALTWGDVRAVQGPVLTAIHVRDPLRDLFEDGPRARLERTLERLAGDGVAVLLSLADSPAAWRGGDPRSELLSTKLRLHVAKAILRDLGIDRVRTT
jgi:hypothetical protein